jgi:sodium-dependent multivitamin transporter 6
MMVGWDVAWSEFSPERLVILDFKNWGFSEEGTYAFWPMLFGGFFLYASYYGTDQSQVQRELTVGNVNDVRKSLMVNAIGRFPLVLLYCIMGVLIGAVISQPESMQVIGSALTISPEKVKMILHNNPDRMVPMFIVSYLPHGVIGFIFVAIMAAMMSSLDSGLNSLSAVTMRDIYQKYVKTEANSSHYLRVSKILTLLWGIFCVVVALAFINFSEATRHTTIVLINAVGSVLYGPILATFLLGMLSKRIGARSIKISFFLGIVLNIILGIFTSVSWLWWNLTGFLSVCLFALLLSSFDYYKQSKKISELIYLGDDEPTKLKWRRYYCLVGLYFILILLVVIFIERIGL